MQLGFVPHWELDTFVAVDMTAVVVVVVVMAVVVAAAAMAVMPPW